MKVHQMTDFGRSLEDLAVPPPLETTPDAQYDEACDVAVESPEAIRTRRRKVAKVYLTVLHHFFFKSATSLQKCCHEEIKIKF